MTAKTNNDPRCAAPADCRKKGVGALCRACHFRSLAITLNADPEFAAHCGFLTAEQLALIALQISDTKDSYLDISMDWLISPGHVGSIAKKFGVQRRPRKTAAALP